MTRRRTILLLSAGAAVVVTAGMVTAAVSFGPTPPVPTALSATTEVSLDASLDAATVAPLESVVAHALTAEVDAGRVDRALADESRTAQMRTALSADARAGRVDELARWETPARAAQQATAIDQALAETFAPAASAAFVGSQAYDAARFEAREWLGARVDGGRAVVGVRGRDVYAAWDGTDRRDPTAEVTVLLIRDVGAAGGWRVAAVRALLLDGD